MKPVKYILFIIALQALPACRSAKKNSASVPTAATAPTGFSPLLPSASGVIEPGPEELSAIQAKYRDTSLDKLKEGYAIYTKGACIGCHNAMDIYTFDEKAWPNIIEDMAARAFLSDAQKDAVHKYVLSVKATQPK